MKKGLKILLVMPLVLIGVTILAVLIILVIMGLVVLFNKWADIAMWVLISSILIFYLYTGTKDIVERYWK